MFRKGKKLKKSKEVRIAKRAIQDNERKNGEGSTKRKEKKEKTKKCIFRIFKIIGKLSKL